MIFVVRSAGPFIWFSFNGISEAMVDDLFMFNQPT